MSSIKKYTTSIHSVIGFRVKAALLCFMLNQLFVLPLTAQTPSFQLVSDSVGVSATYSVIPSYASGMTLRDFNGDGWDDLVLCTDIASGIAFYKNNYGYFAPFDFQIGNINHDRFSVWIDYDNDGYLDFFRVTDTNGVYMYKGDSLGTLTNVTNAIGLGNLNGYLREGALFADFNNDGLLDLHVASHNLVVPNSLFFQTPSNTFVNVSAQSGACDSLDITFFAVAIDYNNDGWMDFYESNDGFTGNLLYKNNGDSTFTEVSVQTGAYQELNSMGLGVGDFDGDLDLDIHVTGRTYETIMLRNNNNGTYTEVAATHNLHYPTGFGWGNIFFDADLDGDNDLYVSGINVPFQNGMPSILYINDGLANFDDDTLEGDSIYSFSNGIFDFNNDRLPDLGALNSSNNPSSVWLNTTQTSTPRFSLKLEGCTSNRDAIGAQIIAFDGPKKSLWMIHSVQSFTSQSSDKQIIPILNGSILDSLKVIWPLGNDTMLYNIAPHQTIVLNECGTANPFPVILVDDYLAHEMVLCPGETIKLKIDGTYNNVIWSTGATTDSIIVTNDGIYNVTVTNQFGYTMASTRPAIITSKSFPDFSTNVIQPNCFNNGVITITPATSINNYNYLWSNNTMANELTGLEPGTYTVTIDNNGHCPVTETFDLLGPDSLNPIQVSLSFSPIACFGETTLVQANGSGGYGTLSYAWSNGMVGDSVYLPAGNFTVTVTDPNDCKINSSLFLTQPTELFVWAEAIPDTNFSSVGKAWVEIDGGTAPYSTQWNDSLNQTGDTAYNLHAGDYEALVTDNRGCIYERSIEVRNRTIAGINNDQESQSIMLQCKTFNSGTMIESTQLLDEKSIAIFDLIGRQIPFEYISVSPKKGIVNINAEGLYILRLTNGSSCKVLY
jgi:hypothetical protein